VVISKRHVTELHQLPSTELAAFWRDVVAVGAVVDELFAPVKLHYLVMGSRAPHLHAHVFPHFADGDPFANVDISEGDVRLTGAEQLERIAAMRAALLNEVGRSSS
jgi:diadenosine tetraphosphate (Ap4A) HIT family hydrolase